MSVHHTALSGAHPSQHLGSLERHLQGTCQPCNYNAFKPDGCRRGDACIFCHHCDKTSARARKKHMQTQHLLKQLVAAAPRQNTLQLVNTTPNAVFLYQPQTTFIRSKASEQVEQCGLTTDTHSFSEMVRNVAKPPGLTLADQFTTWHGSMTSRLASAELFSEPSWSDQKADSEASGATESIKFEDTRLASCSSTSSASAAGRDNGKEKCYFLTLEDVLFG